MAKLQQEVAALREFAGPPPPTSPAGAVWRLILGVAGEADSSSSSEFQSSSDVHRSIFIIRSRDPTRLRCSQTNGFCQPSDLVAAIAARAAAAATGALAVLYAAVALPGVRNALHRALAAEPGTVRLPVLAVLGVAAFVATALSIAAGRAATVRSAV